MAALSVSEHLQFRCELLIDLRRDRRIERALERTALARLFQALGIRAQIRAAPRCLAARMSGCARKTLLAISHDERCHAKKLGAIYFLLTGKKACPKKPENPCITCNAETLRRQYQRELSAREHYEALAPMSGARACTMRELALDECRHAQSIYELLQSCL